MDTLLDIYRNLAIKLLCWMMLPSQPEQAVPNFEGFVVIGVGLPRTGTSSLRVALEKLLHGRCYHTRRMVKGALKDTRHWRKVLTGEISDIEWINFFTSI